MGDNDSVFSDDNLSKSRSYDNNSIGLNNDHMAFFKQADKIRNAPPKFEKKFNKKIDVIEDNGYESQFAPLSFDNPSAPVSSNMVEHKIGNKSGVAKLEMERELALKGNYSNFDKQDMTYNIIDKDHFAHNNMVPFFKSKTGMGYAYDSPESAKVNQVNQRKMELFSGSSKSVDYRPKTERRPLFNPIIGAEKWVYGSPNATNYFETRFIPGKERKNEKPFQEVRVTPGLAKGYNEISKEGFNDSFRALPKDVNELRTANNPKTSYGGVIVPGKKGERRPVQSMVAKHRAPTFKEQDPRDMLKSLTYYRAPSIYGNVDESVPMTNRAVRSREYYGGVAFSKDEARPDSMLEQFRTPNKENFLAPNPRNTTGVNMEKATTNTSNTYDAKQTKRVATEINGYVAPAKTADYTKGRAFDMVTNIPDQNERNATVNNTYVGVAGTERLNKRILFDERNAVTDPNNRNQTEDREYIGHANQGNLNKNYVYDYENNILDSTRRDQTGVAAYIGAAKQSNLDKSYLYDYANNIPDETKRNETMNNTYIGNVGSSRFDKTYAFDHFTNTMDVTKKDTMIKTTYIGNAVNSEYNKPIAFDRVLGTPDTTLKDLVSKTTYLGNVAKSELNKATLFDYANAVTDLTKRDQHINTTYIGNASHASLNKNYAIDRENSVPDPTKRDSMIQNTYSGAIGNGSLNKTYAYDKVANVPDATRRDQYIQTSYIGSAGPSDWKKQQLFDYQNAITDPTKRDTTDKTTYIGQANTTSLLKSYAFDAFTNTPSPTKADTLIDTAYIGHAKNGQYNKGHAFDFVSNIPSPTLKDINIVNTHINGASTAWKQTYALDRINAIPDPGEREIRCVNTNIIGVKGVDMEKGAYAINQGNTQAKVTLRQIIEQNTHINPATLHEGQKTRTREDANNSLVNIAKEQVVTIRDNGAPVTSNYEIGPLYDFTMTQLRTPIDINRAVYGSQPWGNPLQCTSTAYTRQPTSLPLADTRLDTCTLSQLDTNVFVNNTQHKYVEY